MTALHKLPLWQHAASFAARCHAGQLRKDHKTPYVAHPFRVALTVRQLFGVDDEVAMAAALLHDVIEDTPADYDDVLEQFGAEVAGAVAALTKDMRMPEAEREAAYDRQLTAASWQARLVKLADVYDNFCDTLDANSQRKAGLKIERAIECAGDHPKLANAVRLNRELLEQAGTAPQALMGRTELSRRPRR